MSNKPKGYYREPHAATKLEVNMLEYSLKEAKDKLDKKTAELERVTGILEQVTKVADQRAEKLSHFTEVTAALTKRLAWYRIAAIAEAAVILSYFILQGVV